MSYYLGRVTCLGVRCNGAMEKGEQKGEREDENCGRGIEEDSEESGDVRRGKAVCELTIRDPFIRRWSYARKCGHGDLQMDSDGQNQLYTLHIAYNALSWQASTCLHIFLYSISPLLAPAL